MLLQPTSIKLKTGSSAFLEFVDVLESFARSQANSKEGILCYGNRKACLLDERLVEPFDERAAACEDHPTLDEISCELGRAFL